MSNGQDNYLFYLWIEYLQIYRQWIKWWEDFYDFLWTQKLRED